MNTCRECGAAVSFTTDDFGYTWHALYCGSCEKQFWTWIRESNMTYLDWLESTVYA